MAEGASGPSESQSTDDEDILHTAVAFEGFLEPIWTLPIRISYPMTGRAPFADETFDVICSNAVLEHVSDLATLAREMRRVTKEGGIGYHLWHNYYSLSGGHVSDRLAHERPWGHLLGDQDVANHLGLSGTYLNKMLPSDIVKDLSNNLHSVSVFQVDKDHRKKGVDSAFSYEGERLLVPDLESRLSPISREVLLTRAYLLVGRR